MKEWIFTFGFGQKHEGKFIRVLGESRQDARKKIDEMFGNKFAFQYENEEEAGVKEYNLQELK